MDIPYMKYDNKTPNFTAFGGFDFIQENPEISIPYLALISAFTLNGCVWQCYGYRGCFKL